MSVFVAIPDGSDTNAAASSPDGITWTPRALPGGLRWASLAHGDGTFVVVGGNPSNTAATSSSGVTWAAQVLPSSAVWSAIAYGNGTFLAIAQFSTDAATSPDGVTWTAQTLPWPNFWHALAYGNGTFVALAPGQHIAITSPDGATWTDRTLPSAEQWSAVAYGNNTFVAVSYDGSDVAATSPDGATWTAQTLPFAANWFSIAYGNSLFVAVAYGVTQAAISSDGMTWTAQTLPSWQIWYSVAYGNGTFVAVCGAGSNVAAISHDGVTWTARTLSTTANWIAVASDAAPESEGTRARGRTAITVCSMAARADGTTSITITPPVDPLAATASLADAPDLSANGTITSGTAPWDNSISTSDVGYLVWHKLLTSDGGACVFSDDTAFPGDTYMYLYSGPALATVMDDLTLITIDDDDAGAAHSLIDYTTPGNEWLYLGQTGYGGDVIGPQRLIWSVPSAPTSMLRSDGRTDVAVAETVITPSVSAFVAVGFNSALVITSLDGATWTQQVMPSSAGWMSACWGGGQYVALAWWNTIAATSPDGATWTQRTLPVNARWTSVAYGGGMFSAVSDGASSTAISSPDGITWTIRALPSAMEWTSVTYGGGMFVAISGDWGAIAASSIDGITWTQQTLPVSASWTSVTYGGGIFVAISSVWGGIAATSLDGVTWTQQAFVGGGGNLHSVTYGGGQFVAVGFSAIAATSPDGIVWTQRDLPSSQFWMAVRYGNGQFVAVAGNNPCTIAAISADGITWTSQTIPSSDWRALTVATSITPTQSIRSDGWTAILVSTATNPSAVLGAAEADPQPASIGWQRVRFTVNATATVSAIELNSSYTYYGDGGGPIGISADQPVFDADTVPWLGSAVAGPATFGDPYAWHTYALDMSVALLPGVSYWLVSGDPNTSRCVFADQVLSGVIDACDAIDDYYGLPFRLDGGGLAVVVRDLAINVPPVPVGFSTQVEIQVDFSNGNAIMADPADCVFVCADATIATIDIAGILTGVANGDTTLTVTYAGVSTTVAVHAATLLGLDAGPAVHCVMAGGGHMTAWITWSDSTSTIAPWPDCTFTCTDTTIATVDTQGFFAAVAVGDTTLTVTYAGASTTVAVHVFGFTVSPPPPIALVIGGTCQLALLSEYPVGTFTDVTSQCVFYSRYPDVASVTDDGLITALTVGEALFYLTLRDDEGNDLANIDLTGSVNSPPIAAGGKSRYLAQVMLDQVLGQTPWTPPATVHIALSLAPFTHEATGISLSEVVGGSYARIAVPNDTNNWTATDFDLVKTNVNRLNFPTPSANWGAVCSLYLLDAATGGNVLYGANLTGPTVIAAGSSAPGLAAGALSLTEY